MTKTPKILTIGIIIFIIIQTFSFLFLKLAYSPTRAEADWKIPELQITIPGMDKLTQPSACPNDSSKMCVNWIGQYIAGIYRYAVGVIGILAVVVMMVGGIMWIIAGGNTSRVSEAKAWLEASITGLVLTLCSYLILVQINPALVNLKALGVGQPTAKPPTTEANYLQADKLVRDRLTANPNITINKSACQNQGQTDCTSLAYLPENAIQGIINIQQGCSCKIVITGGTEPGHQTHGPNQPIVDIRYDSLLEIYLAPQFNLPNYFIPTNITYENNNMWLLKERNPDTSVHYHINFK